MRCLEAASLISSLSSSPISGSMISTRFTRHATGESSRLNAEQPEEKLVTGFIGNKKSLVFHLPTCPNLPAEKNQIIFYTRNDALAAGYRACGNCHP